MSYTHDIFISYRRNPETVLWIQDHLIPLEHELGNPPDIYTDQRLETGSTWPVDLGTELARSKLLISLWSGNYLNSKWCTLELAHMVAREKKEHLRTPRKSSGVVFFIVIHDGDKIPKELQAVQKLEIQNCFNVRMRRDSVRAEELDAILAQNAAGIAHAIQNAPKFKANWPIKTAASFFNRFHLSDAPSQSTVPKFT